MNADNLAINNSFFWLISGSNIFLIKSLETAVDITNNKPAAVESAAARPPAATNAITH